MNTSIFQAHYSCASLFLALFKTLQERERDDTTSSSKKSISSFEDAYDDYNLWAGNTGAMNSGQQYSESLDYRLREASFYRLQVLRLLKDMQNVLKKAIKLSAQSLVADDEESTSGSEIFDQKESDEEESPWEVSSDSEQENTQKLPTLREPEGSMSPQDSNATRQLYSTFESIRHVVKCLWRLPLRRPVPLDRMQERTTADTSLYQAFDTLHVKNKFPSIPDDLAARLGKMISRRRELIRYRKVHMDVLQKKPERPQGFEAFKGIKVQRAFGVLTSHGDDTQQATSTFEVPSHITSDIKATTPRPHGPVLGLNRSDSHSAPSVSNSGSSTTSIHTSQGTTIGVPRRPRGENGECLEQFMCPYCSTTQLITSDRRWKNHVLSDLQPYICIYPDCHLHEYVFKNKGEWYSHEQSHRSEWFCNHDSHESYQELPAFLDHMKTMHQSKLDHEQVSTLWRGFQRPSQSLAGNCSLCGKYSARLKRHLSRHLEHLALFAIRQTDLVVDVGAEETGSDVAHRRSALTKNSAVPLQHIDSLEQVSAPLNTSVTVLEPQLVNTRSSEVIGEVMPDTSLIVEGSVDTSWDNITSKFQEAREAMYSRKQVDPTGSHPEPKSSDIKDMQTIKSRLSRPPTCGASIGAFRDGKHLPPCSLGGIILIDNEPYGMTVVHLLDDPNGSEDGTLIDPYEDGKTTEEGSSLNHGGSLEFSYDYKLDRANRVKEHGVLVTQPAKDDWIEVKASSASQNHDYLLNVYTLGSVHISSTSWRFLGEVANQMDWALIKIDPDRLPIYNVIQGGKIFCKKRAIGSELPLAHMYTHEYDNDKNEYPKEVADSQNLGGRRVHWYGRTSGLQSGVIQDSKSRVRGMGPPGALPFWDLMKIVQGNCAQEGDAGAWVIDDESRVCGYIVASDYDSKTSYFRPMDLAFQNIRNVLRARTVCLPNSKELRVQSKENNSQAKEDHPQVTIDTSKVEVDSTTQNLHVVYDHHSSGGSDWFCCTCPDGGGSSWSWICVVCRHGRCVNCAYAKDISRHSTSTHEEVK